MMDVGRQCNGSDCSVLAIAFAYDICSGNDLCKIKFDNRLVRQHLASCLEQCRLSHFPVAGEQRCTCVRHTQSVDLHCFCRLPEEKGDKMAECVRFGIISTTWTFLVRYLVTHGHVNHAAVHKDE